MRRLIILNPRSRNGKAEQCFQKQSDRWKNLLGDFSIHKTTQKGDAGNVVRRVVKKGEYDQIIVAGGDGTINEALNGYWENGGLINKDIPLGIIDLGTGGDLIRTVQAASDDYMQALAENRFHHVDCATVSNHYFLNIASTGMAGVMLRNLKSSSFQNGSAAYFYHSLKTLLTYDPQKVTIELDGDPREVDLINLFICNGQYSGGGMQWAPGAKLDDGVLRVTMLSGRKKLPLILESGKLYSGQIEKFPGAETFTAKEIVVKSEGALSLEADGEIISTGECEKPEFRFSVVEKSFPLVM